MQVLLEHNTYDDAKIQLEESVDPSNNTKRMFMNGIFLQADVKNHNQRVYPVNEIRKAVDHLNKRINQYGPVPGECQHPEGLEINIDRISHYISEMWMEGNNGMGKLKILNTPTGNIIKALLEDGVKLGVSSRGSGEVGYDGTVRDFEIITVDIVSQPSAPEAYPKTIYEQIMRSKKGSELLKLSEAINYDRSAQKFFQSELKKWMDDNLSVSRRTK